MSTLADKLQTLAAEARVLDDAPFVTGEDRVRVRALMGDLARSGVDPALLRELKAVIYPLLGMHKPGNLSPRKAADVGRLEERRRDRVSPRKL